MKEYEKYASFTENGLVYEKDYEKKFEALFIRPVSKDEENQVFNDVDSLNKPSYISIREYIKKVRRIYPKGMNMDVNIKNIGVSESKNGKERFEIKVHKKIYGLYAGKKILTMDYDMTFLLEYNGKKVEGDRIRIVKINGKRFPPRSLR
jgi:hypothetical protein